MASVQQTLAVPALAASLFLGTGVTPQHGPPLVARVQTLTPAPYVAASSAPLIEETVVYVEYPTIQTNTSPAPSQVGSNDGGLTGTLGYARSSGNCVNEPGVKNPGWGNPIDWPASTRTAYIGATFLFYYNHTGVVTGIWSNGDVEVRHQNYRGGQHRFPASMFRGFI